MAPDGGFAISLPSARLQKILGFGLLALLWLFTGLEAYRMVRRATS